MFMIIGTIKDGREGGSAELKSSLHKYRELRSSYEIWMYHEMDTSDKN